MAKKLPKYIKFFRARLLRKFEAFVLIPIFLFEWVLYSRKLQTILDFFIPSFDQICLILYKKYKLKFSQKLPDLVRNLNYVETYFYVSSYSLLEFSLSKGSNVFPPFNPNYSFNISQCPQCFFDKHPFQTANSNEKDLILLFSFTKFLNLDILLRSIRSANCHATVFVQTDQSGYKLLQHNHFYAFLSSKCGLHFQVLPFPRLSASSKYIFRMYLRLSFLSSQLGQYFERVLFIDPFDCFLQGDPFFKEMKNDTIYLTAEDQYFIHNEIEVYEKVLNQSEKLHLKEIENNHMVNGAIYLGYTTPMVKFLLFLFDGHVEYKDFESNDQEEPRSPFNYDDQVLLNMVLFGDIKRKPLPVKIHIYDVNYTLCIHLATIQPVLEHVQFGNITFKNGKGYPPILHQTVRHPVMYSTYNVCPSISRYY